MKIKKGELTENYLNKIILKRVGIKKKEFSDILINSDIETLSKFALDSGANSIKLLGAGGGGFLLVVGSKKYT